MNPRMENLFSNPNLPPGADSAIDAPWKDEPEEEDETDAFPEPTLNGLPGLLVHQETALELALQYEEYGVFCDTGTGKTRIALELIEKIGGPAFGPTLRQFLPQHLEAVVIHTVDVCMLLERLQSCFLGSCPQ